ncbi:hypothetical protein BRC68_16420 [Halobacteriales archaeon QH_6_64_20]|nr:MAG: hypothetical protein BRC68_16420 [Halobacteriales archaeon QH_6_64_20]
MADDSGTRSRRDVLRLAGASGAVGIAGLAGCTGGGGEGGGGGGGNDSGGGEDYPSLGNFPIEGDTATFGFTVPQSGSYQAEGASELDAYKLAVKHLNEGGGWVDSFEDLSGDGVLGKQIDYVEGDYDRFGLPALRLPGGVQRVHDRPGARPAGDGGVRG